MGNIAYCMDCLPAMKRLPDNAFDLAVVDPPYGNALTDVMGGVNRGIDLANDLTDTSILWISRGGRKAEIPPRHDTSHSEHGRSTAPIRTGGTWAAKFGKKL